MASECLKFSRMQLNVILILFNSSHLFFFFFSFPVKFHCLNPSIYQFHNQNLYLVANSKKVLETTGKLL